MRSSYFAIALAAWSVAAPARPAGPAIVLAVDVSASVTPNTFILQRNGIADAFEEPRLQHAIAAVGGIEVLVLQWSDPEATKVSVDWTRIDDPASAAAFAAKVHAMDRESHGLTAIGPALAAAAAQFNRLPQPSTRRVIDLSGDGIANLGTPPQIVRDRLVAAGITIDGLAIPTEEPWLADYYRREVIGGPGSFVLTARDYGSFAAAMLRKLATEVAGGERRDSVRCNWCEAAQNRNRRCE